MNPARTGVKRIEGVRDDGAVGMKGRHGGRDEGGSGGASEDVSVWVVRGDGELVEAGEYVFDVVRKGGDGVVRAGSQQVGAAVRVPKWAGPRVAMRDLLLFYDANVWHRRCVMMKALLVAGLGWQLLEGDEVVYDPRVDRRVPDHGAARFAARPNEHPLESFDELVFRLLVDFYSQGNGYLEVVRDRRGTVVEVYHVPARTMRRDAQFGGYWQVKRMQEQPFATFGARDRRPGMNEILHLYQYDPVADYYGVPDWFAALMTMGLDRTMLEYNLRLFANSLMAHMAIVVEGGRLSKAGRDAVKQFIKDRALGVANAGRVLLLEDENDRVKVRFEKLNLEVKDLLTVKPHEHYRDVVVAAHGVPPRLLGILTPGQLGGGGEMENQLRTFKETVLRPAQRRLEVVLGVLLEAVHPGARVRFAEMDVTNLRDDAQFWSTMIERGVYTAREVREVLERVRG